MTRAEIITELKKYFKIKDLVCSHAFKNWGELAWQFLDTELLHTIWIVRTQILKTGMTVNHGTSFQRGLRCNICQIVMDETAKGKSYLSAHVNGAGIDFDATGLTAEQARQKIIENQDLLPYPIRFEKGVTWVHMDVYDIGNGLKVNLFK
jgi:hypothetical protein